MPLSTYMPYFNSGLFGCNYCGEARIIYSNKEYEEITDTDMVKVGELLFGYSTENKEFILESCEIILPPVTCTSKTVAHWTDYSIYCHICNDWSIRFNRYQMGEYMLEFIRIQVEEAKASYMPVSFTIYGRHALIGYYSEPVSWESLLGTQSIREKSIECSNFSAC